MISLIESFKIIQVNIYTNQRNRLTDFKYKYMVNKGQGGKGYLRSLGIYIYTLLYIY